MLPNHCLDFAAAYNTCSDRGLKKIFSLQYIQKKMENISQKTGQG